MSPIRDLKRLMPQAEKACRLFLAECERRNLQVLVTETLRTATRQQELYAIGRTKPGKKVTWTKTSRHQSGLAWDICKNQRGCEYSDTEFFKACGDVARELGITWGGDWKNKDMPHFEVSGNWEVPYLEEIKRILADLDELKNSRKVYRYTVDLPDWARGTVQKLMNKGVFAGKSEDDLDLSEEMARILVILDRAGIFDR